MRNASVVMILVKEEFLGPILLLRDGNQVEIVENLLLLGPPVIIVEVIVNPHEALVYHLRNDRFPDARA